MKSWIFITVLVSMLGTAAYFVYTSMQSDIKTLNTMLAAMKANEAVLLSNQEELKRALSTSNESLVELRTLYDRNLSDYNELQREFSETRARVLELRERLTRHDLDALAAARPGLVERTINNATANVLRCLELLSGSPFTEREKNATTEREFNPECGYLMHSSSR